MESLTDLKNNLIDQILISENEGLLIAIQGILNSTVRNKKILSLDSYQIEMLLMSEKDISEGNLISEEDLRKEDFVKRN